MATNADIIKEMKLKEEPFTRVNQFGDKFYYSDRTRPVLHREDGPAVEWSDGVKEWWVNGKELSQKEFNNIFRRN